MQPRCPECDIELDCSSDKWVCPLCHQTPRPEQYLKVAIPPAIVNDPLKLRDLMTGAATLMEEIVAAEPGLAEPLAKAYRMAQDIAERADQDGHYQE